MKFKSCFIQLDRKSHCATDKELQASANGL